MNYLRIKNTIPFSERLNEWIIERAKSIDYVSGADFDEVSFEDFKEAYLSDGYMKISSLHCENNIFADVSVNIAFRAWHDQVHILLNEGFDYMGEARVAFAQCSELPNEWGLEKQLIMVEVVAQAAYHEKYGDYVPNQREFTKSVFI